jgi:hypothetical protein
MGKNQSASGLTNIVQYDTAGNISLVSGSTTLLHISSSGAITTTGVISGSNALSASYAISASNALNATTASYVQNAQSASYVLNAQSASFVALAQSASNAVAAQTASYANNLTVASTLTAQTLVVQTITSSVDFVTGSTRFGSILGNTHVFSGSVTMNPGGLFVSSSGLVGIGTVTPSNILTVVGGSASPVALNLSNANSNCDIIMTSGAGGGLVRLRNNLDDFQIHTNGVQRFTITSTGAATFGTTASTIYGTLNIIQQSVSAPSFVRGIELVHPNGTGATGGYIGISMTGQKQGTIQVGDDGAVGDLLLQSQGGNVGIGTINPSYRLHVSGAFSSNPGLYLYGTTYAMMGVDRGSSAASAGTSYYTTGSQRWFTGIYENTNNFGFYNAGNVNFPLVIQYSDGNIGVGITSPYTKLQIQGGHASIQSNSTASTDGAGDTRNAGFGFRHASADLISALINTTAVADWGLNLHFNTRQFNATMPATPAMTITAGQNIGIGKTDPEGPLHINGAIGAGYIGMAITNFSNTIGTTAGIDFGSDASTCYNGAGNGQIAVTNIGGTGGGQSAEMNLKVWTGSALVTGIKINNTGRVSFPTATAQNYGLSNATAVTINSGSGTIASCSITSVGKPILINLTGDINPVGGPSWCYLYIYRNGSPIGKFIIAESPGASTNIPFALSTIDIPGAGTHTYTGYTTIGGANPIQFGETGNSQAPTILAIELL